MNTKGLDSLRRLSLTVKLPITFAAIVLTVATISGALSVSRESAAMSAGLENSARQIALSVASQSADSVRRSDYWVMYANLKKQAGSVGADGIQVLFAAIVSDSGIVLAHTQPDSNRIGQPFALAGRHAEAFAAPAQAVVRDLVLDRRPLVLAGAPITWGSQPLAQVWIAVDGSPLADRMRTATIGIAAVSAALAVLGIVGGWMLSRRMVGPLRALTAAVARAREGRLDDVGPIRVQEYDEIGRLTHAFNAFVAESQDRAELERQLRLHDKLVAVGQMVAGVAHEVNNPLAGMKTAVETLKLLGDDADRRAEAIRLLRLGIDHIEGVVGALQIVHRAPEEETTCDPRALDDLFLLIRSECERRGIEVGWHNRLTGAISVAPGRLKQILINLLMNAVKAMPAGGILTFSATETSGGYEFAVEDTGRGMIQAQLDRIFEPFYTTRPDGSGLGLWICLQLAEGMNASIAVASDEGAGSIFRLSMPRPAERREIEGHERAPSALSY